MEDTKETKTQEDKDESLADIANRCVPTIKLQYAASTNYKQPKLEKIKKAEELYFNVVSKTLKGRFNVPIPIVSGFVDTLLSKIDDEITINFDPTEDADKIKCRKCNAAWKYDSAPTRGMWGIKDILAKKLALFAGRVQYKIFSANIPKYKNYFDIVDLFDFHCEPSGGWHLENHLFCGQDNIFKSQYDIEHNDSYDQTQVKKLISTVNSDEFKKNNELYLNRMQRLQNLGLDPQTNNYVGVNLFNLCEWNFYDNKTGKRYYILLDVVAGVWLRICPLEEITGEPEAGELPRYMFKSWATHTDYWNYLSKAPVDDVLPVAIAMKTITNFMFDDVQKRLWGQRIYDPEIITDPSQLEWDRPDKLIMATVPNGKKISDGVWQFPVGDQSTVTVNLLDYFRNFIGTEAGVTSQTKGESDEKLLGIAQINQGEVADRLGLTNKQYTQCYAEIGEGYLAGLKMCMDTSMLVRMIGENGLESTELTKEELKFDSRPDIRITGGKTEARKNSIIQEAKSNSIVTVAKLFPEMLNRKIAAENILRNGQWETNEITPLLDPTLDGNEDEDVRASQSIQDFINKKKPELYKGATTRFSQKIIDYAIKNKINPMLQQALMQYVQAHTDIIIANMERKRVLASLNQPQPQDMNSSSSNGIKSPLQPNKEGIIQENQ